MADLTRDTLPSPEARRPLKAVEGLGGTLYVRPISAQAGTSLPDSEAEYGAFLAALLMTSVVFADGTPVWTKEEEVLAYPTRDLKPLMLAALEVNNLTEKAVEDIKGN